MIFVGTRDLHRRFVGLLSVTVGGLPLTLTASGGALIMGLVFGWLRAVRPYVRPDPGAGDLGVRHRRAMRLHRRGGPERGPRLRLRASENRRQPGPGRLLVAVIPHTLAILFGRYVLRMNR